MQQRAPPPPAPNSVSDSTPGGAVSMSPTAQDSAPAEPQNPAPPVPDGPVAEPAEADGDGDGAATHGLSSQVHDTAPASAPRDDLRRLRMRTAGEILRGLGVPEDDIRRLRRWDRIYLIRELQRRATARGFNVDLLQRRRPREQIASDPADAAAPLTR